MTFSSQHTVLPAFVLHLGAPNVVIGAIPAVMTVGWLLPSLFVAGHTEALARKLPFILRYTVWERVAYVGLALIAFLVARRAPDVALALTLAVLLVTTGVGGVLMPAWMDVVGRAIPTTLRGRFFAGAHLLASLGGLAAGAATAWILDAVGPPAGFGVCFLATAAFLGAAYLALRRVREPVDHTPAPPVPLRAYLARIPAILRGDRDLAWYLAARTLSILGTMGTAFYTVYALRAHGAADWQVGLFTALLLGGQLAGTLVLGSLADRLGHRVVVLVGVAAAVAAASVAVFAPALQPFALVFPLAGINLAAINISARTVLLEFAPTVAERPTYLGIGNTALAPVSFGAPLLAGVLADTVGFATTFAVSAGFGVAGLVVLARVREPRRR
jgi:MFS family permease